MGSLKQPCNGQLGSVKILHSGHKLLTDSKNDLGKQTWHNQEECVHGIFVGLLHYLFSQAKILLN